eukprot:g63796.t1
MGVSGFSGFWLLAGRASDPDLITRWIWVFHLEVSSWTEKELSSCSKLGRDVREWAMSKQPVEWCPGCGGKGFQRNLVPHPTEPSYWHEKCLNTRWFGLGKKLLQEHFFHFSLQKSLNRNSYSDT